MQKLLIVHRGALGDFVCTWPALAWLQTLFPGTTVTLIGRPEYAGLARELGLVKGGLDAESTALLPFFSGTSLPVALAGGYDTVLLWLKEPGSTINLLTDNGITCVAIPPFPAGTVHASDHHLQCLCRSLDLPVPQNRDYLPDRWQPEGTMVLFAPGSGSPAKNHPLEQYLLAAQSVIKNKLGSPSFIIGPPERDLTAAIRDKGFPVHEPSSATDLARLLARGRAFIGNDSGPGHLAAWLGVPSLALFKTTDPDIWGIRGSRAVNRKVTQPESIPDLVRGFLTA